MRIVNRLLAFVVALALIGVCVIVIVEVIAERSAASTQIIQWHSMLGWIQRNTWKATSVELACWGTAAAGLLILIPQLIRRKPSRLHIDASDITAADPSHATEAALTRKGVATTVRIAVEDVEGISRTRVKVGRGRIRVLATATATDPASIRDLEPKVAEAAHAHLDALRLRPVHHIRVAVSSRRNGAA